MLRHLRVDWKTVAMAVLGALLSLVCWQANNSLGRLEAAESEIAALHSSQAVANEALLNFRADQRETLERVKRIENLLLGGK